ncbi:retrotransposon protein, putative, ty1-copia subclass [Tanacetum coccineum]
MRETHVDLQSQGNYTLFRETMALPVQNINHSAFRSMFEKEKLSGNNFNDWFARLKLVLRVEKKMHVIEQPLPPAPEAGAEPTCCGLNGQLYMMLILRLLCPMLGEMVQSRRPIRNHLKQKAKNKVNGKGKDKKVYVPKPNNPKPTAKERPAKDDACHHLIDAMNAEIQSMMDNMVWVLVDLPPGCKTVGSRWLFKKKTDMDGIVHVYKARLVAKGYTQLYGVDYEETFSPVADIRAIRILISIAAYYDYEIWQMDVKTTSYIGYLDEDIYRGNPEGFVDCLINLKSIQASKIFNLCLKQASRARIKYLEYEIKVWSCSKLISHVIQKASGSNVTFLILYVDDIIIMGNHIPSLQSVKDYLGKCFAMKDLGEAAFILGIKIYRDRSKRLIGLCQNAYMDKILKRYKMDNSKRGHIPMQERLDLNKSQGAQTPKEVNRMKNVPYASAVGSIMYAVRCTRPDVAFAQNMTSTELRVECYCDAGFETDRDDTKSQTGYVFILNGGAVVERASSEVPRNVLLQNPICSQIDISTMHVTKILSLLIIGVDFEHDEYSKMGKGLIRFAQRNDEIVFRMPQRTKELDLVSPLENDKFEAFFVDSLKVIFDEKKLGSS